MERIAMVIYNINSYKSYNTACWGDLRVYGVHNHVGPEMGHRHHQKDGPAEAVLRQLRKYNLHQGLLVLFLNISELRTAFADQMSEMLIQPLKCFIFILSSPIEKRQMVDESFREK